MELASANLAALCESLLIAQRMIVCGSGFSKSTLLVFNFLEQIERRVRVNSVVPGAADRREQFEAKLRLLNDEDKLGSQMLAGCQVR